MKKWFLLPVIILTVSCSKPDNNPEIYFNARKALAYFSAIDSICEADKGKLWGTNLAGPVVFIDRPTRRMFANKPDNEGQLKLKEGVYQGIFSRERLIENSAVEIGGKIFAMVPLPPREDGYRIKTSAINALFHCLQKNLGVTHERFAIRSMDDRFARIWLKLEFRALKKAIEAESPDLISHIRDAIIFRGARRELFPSSIKEENRFEIYEGLSLFTSTLLCAKSQEEAKHRFQENLDIVYKFPSYSRAYGSIIGSTYTYLLYSGGYNIKPLLKSDTTDLGDIVIRYFNLRVPAIYRDVAGSLALVYDVDNIYKEEEQRMNEIRERIRRQLSKFTEKPIVTIELESPYFDFEPEDIRSLDTLGTIYNSIRIADNWGKLTVEKGGCLVSYNLKYVRLPAKNLKESKNHYYCDGWHIIVSNNWKIVKVDDNYVLRKATP